MKSPDITTLPAFQTLLSNCIAQFNPVFVISEDQQSICLNGKPLISIDPTVFVEGVFIDHFGYQILRHVRLLDEGQPLSYMAHNLMHGIYPCANRCINGDVVKAQFKALDEDTQNQLIKGYGCKTATISLLWYLEGCLQKAMRNYSEQHSDNEAIKEWLRSQIDEDFLRLIHSGLGGMSGLHQYFTIAQNQQVITKFLAKYPHMLPMLRPLWEASDSAPERNLFGQLKTLADMEQGAFLVELYDQDYRHYAYADCTQKFLADAESWQWLLTQPQKTIDIVMKHYTINDNKKDSLAYHSFGRTRENLSLIAHLKLDTKLAQAMLKDCAASSIDNDRFAIDVCHDQDDLKKQDFHSGQRYRDYAALVFGYMDSKGMDVDTRIKFLRTFKGAIKEIATHVRYVKKHTDTTLSDHEIIDAWVQKQFSRLKKVNRNTYVPEPVSA